MSRVFLACALAVLIPAAARGEPISLTAGAGAAHSGTVVANGSKIDLGVLGLTAGSSGTFFFNNLSGWRDFQLSFDLKLPNLSGLKIELLDPLGDGDDQFDDNDGVNTASLPEGYSTSHNLDGLSFAQGSGLERSAVFAGGSANVEANETSHRGDILLFSGLGGAERARVTFGLRNTMAGRGFALRFSWVQPTAHAPEPATMLLLGTGLAGLAAARRRRRQNAGAAA
jgi:hypothetical protein